MFIAFLDRTQNGYVLGVFPANKLKTVSEKREEKQEEKRERKKIGTKMVKKIGQKTDVKKSTSGFWVRKFLYPP